MGVMTTKFLGKFGEIVFILRNAFIYRGLRKFLGDCYTLSPAHNERLHNLIQFFLRKTEIAADEGCKIGIHIWILTLAPPYPIIRTQLFQYMKQNLEMNIGLLIRYPPYILIDGKHLYQLLKYPFHQIRCLALFQYHVVRLSYFIGNVCCRRPFQTCR